MFIKPKEYQLNKSRTKRLLLSSFPGHDHNYISCIVIDISIRVLVWIGICVNSVDINIIVVDVIVHINNQGEDSGNKTQEMESVWPA